MAPTREALDTLFERAPRFVERLAELRAPTWVELFEQAEWIALTMPEDEQIELLNAHPRIGADPATVSALSYREQGYDREPETIAGASAALQSRLDALNDEYERRFGFRFVVFVNGRSRAEIADVLERHMDGDRTAEKMRALRAVIAIARKRSTTIEEGS
jgi:2-oxo-4-hydroxy-4-carboxy--5-ureidoimidazoline (OHCU) decarboxylase